MKKQPSLNAKEMETRLNALIDTEFSMRCFTEQAQQLTRFNRVQQEFVLHWVEVLTQTSEDFADQFVSISAKALDLMSQESIRALILQAMDAFDEMGALEAIKILREVESFAKNEAKKQSGVALDDVSGILEHFVCGLNGRQLKIQSALESYTDTENIYLPALITHFSNKEDNFRLYKALLVHQWAQTWYGSWRIVEILQAHLETLEKPELFLSAFHFFETIRLDHCIARDFPGQYRDMYRLRTLLTQQLEQSWYQKTKILCAHTATVKDSYLLSKQYYNELSPTRCCYQGILQLDQIIQTMSERIESEKARFKIDLKNILDEIKEKNIAPESQVVEEKFHVDIDKSDIDGELEITLYLDGEPVAPPEETLATLESIIQDLGDIPDDYLVPAGDGDYTLEARSNKQDSHNIWGGVLQDEGIYLYKEWDYLRQHYRKDWCVLKEKDVHPSYDHFVTKALQQHKGLIKSLRRTFEALRGENKRLKKQPFGEDIDIDAVVEAYADQQVGLEGSDCLFTRMQKEDRNIAVMLMVDMSGSTKGWINDAEREALVLLSESLETLGDQYAIYGFSGMTRSRCELYRVKRFDEPYNDLVKARISGIRPQDYTRMGVAIRHLSFLLNEVAARTRILITLSDGKPDDYRDYRGEQGIEDTRLALFEAKQSGIHPFCITIDTDGKEYLPHMYGVANYIVLDDVAKLPLKVSDIYRKLTS